MFSRPSLFLGLCFVLLLASSSVSGQVTEQVTTGGALGYHEFGRDLSRPLALNDTTVVLASPSSFAYPDRSTAGLRVYRRILGTRENYFVPIPGYASAVEGIWAKPYRLDDKALVLPGTGPDGVRGSSDDTLILVRRLDTPAVATVYTYAIGQPGVRQGDDLVVMAPRTVAWIDAHRDGPSASGSQLLTIVHDLGGPGEYTQVIDLSLQGVGGTDGYFEPMGPGRFGMIFLGLDQVWGTADDAVGMMELDASGMNVVLHVVQLREPLRVPQGSRWPRWIGGKDLLVYGDTEPSTSLDDVEIIIRNLGGATSVRATLLTTAPGFQGQEASIDVALDAQGTAILAAAGPDGVTGTFDDQIIVRSAIGQDVLTPLAALAPASGAPLSAAVSVECGATIYKMFGRLGYGVNDKGIVVVSAPDPVTGARSVAILSTFENVNKIVPMAADSAMLFADNGQAFYVTDMDTPGPTLAAVTGGLWDGQSEPIALNSAIVATTSMGNPTPSFSVSDSLTMFKVPAIWNFGQATSNDQGYALKIGSPTKRLSFANPYFGINLSGAPANELCALFISFHRDNIFVASDGSLFLLSAEDIIYSFFWSTLGDGTTLAVLPTPSDPFWFGHGAHYQWFVMNPLSARGWELSDGLTLTM